MAEGNSISEEVRAEDEEGCLEDDKREQAFVLLLRVTQANGKPLPIGGFTSRAMAQMLYEIAGVTPRDVVILTDQEGVTELEKENTNNGGVKSSAWIVSMGWKSITVDSVVAWRDSIKEIVKEQEIAREKQKELEQEH